MEFLAWLLLALLFYTYLGYGLLVQVLVLCWPRKPKLDPEKWPGISLIVPAYNELDCLEQKLQNTLELDYPRDAFECIVITDGSNDGSESMPVPQGFQRIHQSRRAGKASAINRAVPFAKFPIVAITDANTMLHAGALKALAKPFCDPKVAGVSGEKVVRSVPGAATAQEGLYWRYESWLKRLDAEWHTLIGAAGELFAFRANAFEPLETDAILDDFVLSVRLVQNGFRVAYAPTAKAFEDPSPSLASEWKRKVRIAAGAFQSIPRLPLCYMPWKYPLPWFQFFSRRLLRWVFAPLALPLLFVLSWCLAPSLRFWMVLALTQSVFYFLALVGLVFQHHPRVPAASRIPFYFVFMHLALIFGFVRHLRKTQSPLWEKAR